jgi:2-C-methyl-D-erythritol 4-phosphate cytidylyltransferase
MSGITAAVLRADLGSRINFERDAQIVRVENWLMVAQTVEAIARSGYTVAAVVDASNDIPSFVPAR